MLEIIGYVGRVLIGVELFGNNAALIYLICVTIAPALPCAGICSCLTRIVTIYGSNIFRFKPCTYAIIFYSCGLFSLVLQGLGGGIAATVVPNSGENTGKNIIVAGMVVQVFSLILFAVCCSEFTLRVRLDEGGKDPRFIKIASSRLFKSFLCSAFFLKLDVS